MSLLGVLQNGVKTLNRITRSGGLQAQITYVQKTGATASDPSFAAGVPVHAHVDFKAVQVRTREGTLATTRAVLTWTDVAEILLVTGGRGVTVDDFFTLTDGSVGPVLSVGGYIDSGTGQPVATEIYLG